MKQILFCLIAIKNLCFSSEFNQNELKLNQKALKKFEQEQKDYIDSSDFILYLNYKGIFLDEDLVNLCLDTYVFVDRFVILRDIVIKIIDIGEKTEPSRHFKRIIFNNQGCFNKIVEMDFLLSFATSLQENFPKILLQEKLDIFLTIKGQLEVLKILEVAATNQYNLLKYSRTLRSLRKDCLQMIDEIIRQLVLLCKKRNVAPGL